MKCREVNFLLSEYYKNSLDLNDREKVEKHLRECESCRLRLREIEQTFQLLEKETLPQPEESFWISFLPEVRSRIERKEKLKEKIVPKMRPAFGLLSVLLAVIVSYLLFTIDRENIAQRPSEQSGEDVLIVSDFSSSADQLAEMLLSEGDQTSSIEIVLSEDEKQNLDLSETLLRDDYSSQSVIDRSTFGGKGLSVTLDELNSEELKQLEESIKHLQVSDIL